MIAKILFTVFCLMVIGTESRHFLGRGKSSDDPTLNAFLCNQAVENCAYDMVRQYDHIWKSETPEEFIYQDGFIDEVCNEVQPMKECVQEVLNTHKCSNDQREMLTVYINLEDPACTDEGKQAILATADSACWQDKEMGYEAIMSARGCYGTFMFETDSTCQSLEKLDTCVTTSLTPCGQSVLDLYNKAKPAVITFFPDLQHCLTDSDQAN